MKRPDYGGATPEDLARTLLRPLRPRPVRKPVVRDAMLDRLVREGHPPAGGVLVGVDGGVRVRVSGDEAL